VAISDTHATTSLQLEERTTAKTIGTQTEAELAFLPVHETTTAGTPVFEYKYTRTPAINPISSCGYPKTSPAAGLFRFPSMIRFLASTDLHVLQHLPARERLSLFGRATTSCQISNGLAGRRAGERNIGKEVVLPPIIVRTCHTTSSTQFYSPYHGRTRSHLPQPPNRCAPLPPTWHYIPLPRLLSLLPHLPHPRIRTPFPWRIQTINPPRPWLSRTRLFMAPHHAFPRRPLPRLPRRCHGPTRLRAYISP
jgi:hypothetical protein